MNAPNVLGFDVETHLITPTSVRPPLVCGTFAGGGDTLELVLDFLDAYEGDYLSYFGDATFHPNVTWELLLDKPGTLAFVLHAIDKVDRIAAHNQVFDWGVICNEMPDLLPAVATAFELGRLACTKVREMLICIATDNFKYDSRGGKPKPGIFTLARLAEVYFDLDLSSDKTAPDAWRLRYSELDGVPLHLWPMDAVRYAIMDASLAYLAYHRQARPFAYPEGDVVTAEGLVVNELEQEAADWVLQDMACNGPITDLPYVRAFEKEVRARVERLEVVAQEAGFLRVNKCKSCGGTGKCEPITAWSGNPADLTDCPFCDGLPHHECIATGRYKSRARMDKTSKDMARLGKMVDWALGGEAPRTPTGKVKTDSDTIELTGIPLLVEYAQNSQAKKLLDTYLPILYRGIDSPILSKPNVLVRSGRTSWKDPNFQNPPAFGLFRECFVARRGKVMCSIDYSGLEMTTLAQVCLELFGHSKMAEAINAGRDLHLDFAVHMLRAGGHHGLTYEEAAIAKGDKDHPLHKDVKAYRQRAKAANFGFPGGLGASAFLRYAENYGLNLTHEQAVELRKLWLEAWPEMADYFRMMSDASDLGGGKFRVKQFASNRIRGGCHYTSGANTMFQGLASDGAKAALWELWKACNLDETSPLFGVTMWAFIHDEVLFEGPETTAHLWAAEASRIMVECMERYTPDVKQAAEPALMPRWLKKASPAFVSGKLMPWYPSMVDDPASYTVKEYEAHKKAYLEEDARIRAEYGEVA